MTPDNTDTLPISDADLAVTRDFVIKILCGVHKLSLTDNGHFLLMAATAEDNGIITLDVTRVRFGEDNTTLRMSLHITSPIPVTPALPDTTSPEPMDVA